MDRPKARSGVNLKPSAGTPSGLLSSLRAGGTFVCALAAATLTAGCWTFSKPLPPVNLEDPAWELHQGQAVWRLPKGSNDIAGDLLVAVTPAGQSFVQFSKTPFPILVGQASTKHWQVELPTQNRRFSGPGSPPKRLIWMYLPRALAGKPLPTHWTWTRTGDNWRLENKKTGETIEGFFSQ